MVTLQTNGSPQGFNLWTKLWHFWGRTKQGFEVLGEIFLNFNFFRVPFNKELLTRTVPVNKKLLTGTVNYLRTFTMCYHQIKAVKIN